MIVSIIIHSVKPFLSRLSLNKFHIDWAYNAINCIKTQLVDKVKLESTFIAVTVHTIFIAELDFNPLKCKVWIKIKELSRHTYSFINKTFVSILEYILTLKMPGSVKSIKSRHCRDISRSFLVKLK